MNQPKSQAANSNKEYFDEKLIILSLFLSNMFDIYIRYVKQSEIMKLSFIITNHVLIIIYFYYFLMFISSETFLGNISRINIKIF